jgi:hypothetical protein
MWVDIDSRHFQNGHHNIAQIQHCPISMPFHMWVDYDVPNWFLTSKNFYRSPFSKWPPEYRTNSTLSDFNDISYVGRLWCPEMIPHIEKFLPGINSGHHNLPTYEMALKSDNVEFVRYCGGHFENVGNQYLPTYQILMISDNVEYLRYCGGHFENGDR